MWKKIKRAFVAFEMYAEALLALPLVVAGGFAVVAARGTSDSDRSVLVMYVAFVALGVSATYKTLRRLGWIGRG